MNREVNEELWFQILNEEFDKITEETGEFENEIFFCHQYRWDDGIDSNDLEKDPCFYHKPTGFKMSWYKYPLRSPEANMNISYEKFRAVLYDCKNSLYGVDGALNKHNKGSVKWEIEKWWK